ncbi:hypothetical protein SZN_00150 [Streptomyces zinciresistens K42]|uniref:Uncharacterized protein n=1 Tax=Streptomyces zinciresistens K42 TaxID=700597 RepID=G2G3H9_9ACTN|nr:hypothetical protein SZN_00150 [Streptomyces zinciresistens K42]
MLPAAHVALNVLLAARPAWIHDIMVSTLSDWAATDTSWFLVRDDLDETVYPAVISVEEERITITHTRAVGRHPYFEQEAGETTVPLTPRGIEHLRHLLPAIETAGLPSVPAAA